MTEPLYVNVYADLLDAAVRLLANAPDDIDPTDYKMLLLAVRAVKATQRRLDNTTPTRVRHYRRE